MDMARQANSQLTELAEGGIVPSRTVPPFTYMGGGSMPYIEVDEVPEGTEVADVVSRADYDSLVTERDNAEQQRDEALSQIEEARKEVRDTKALYADAILSANRKKEPSQQGNQGKVKKPSLAMTASELFG